MVARRQVAPARPEEVVGSVSPRLQPTIGPRASRVPSLFKMNVGRTAIAPFPTEAQASAAALQMGAEATADSTNACRVTVASTLTAPAATVRRRKEPAASTRPVSSATTATPGPTPASTTATATADYVNTARCSITGPARPGSSATGDSCVAGDRAAIAISLAASCAVVWRGRPAPSVRPRYPRRPTARAAGRTRFPPVKRRRIPSLRGP